MKIALYKNTEHTWDSGSTPWQVDMAKHLKNYVQVSEAVDVEFPPLSDESVVRQQLDVLDEQERELRNRFEQHLKGIKDRRAELQALTFIPAA